MDINISNLPEYIKSHTDIFKENEKLECEEIVASNDYIDSFVNYIYRVKNSSGKSIVVKHAESYIRCFGEGGKLLTKNRIVQEYKSYVLRSAISPKFIPEVYYLDIENSLFIMEDIKDSITLRYSLAKGDTHCGLAKEVGEYLAYNAFCTSDLYLDSIEHKKLNKVFNNAEMRDIMENVSFKIDEWDDIKVDAEYDDEFIELKNFAMKRDGLVLEMHKMRDVFMNNAECIVHGDLHTSNIIVNKDNKINVIDMEYTFMGSYSADAGYLCANLMYQYTAWLHRDDCCINDRISKSNEMLGYITEIYTNFIDIFSELYDDYAKESYKAIKGYKEYTVSNILENFIGIMASACICRGINDRELIDYRYLTIENSLKARRLNVYICEHIMNNRKDIVDINQLMESIKKVSTAYMVINSAF